MWRAASFILKKKAALAHWFLIIPHFNFIKALIWSDVTLWENYKKMNLPHDFGLIIGFPPNTITSL